MPWFWSPSCDREEQRRERAEQADPQHTEQRHPDAHDRGFGARPHEVPEQAHRGGEEQDGGDRLVAVVVAADHQADAAGDADDRDRVVADLAEHAVELGDGQADDRGDEDAARRPGRS